MVEPIAFVSRQRTLTVFVVEPGSAQILMHVANYIRGSNRAVFDHARSREGVIEPC